MAVERKSEEMRGIEDMYSIFEKLNTTSDKPSMEGDFRKLLTFVTKSSKEKRLASQFIVRFMEHFPSLIDEVTIDSLYDLCDDDDIHVRKQVTKDLVTVCNKMKEYIPKIVDVYAQMIGTSDAGELSVVQNSLSSVLLMDVDATLTGLFWRMRESEGDSAIVERCLNFLASKIKNLDSEIITAKVEATLLSELKPTIKVLSGDSFKTIMEIISYTKILESVKGKKAVTDIIIELLDVDKTFDGTLEDNIHRLTQCGENLLKLVSAEKDAAKPLLIYICTNVIPNFLDFICHENGESMQLDVLKLMSEAALNLKSMDSELVEKCQTIIYNQLLMNLPAPSTETNESYNYNYSCIECYLFVMYKLCSVKPEFLNEDQNKLLDFRKRLQYFARVLMGYIKKLKEDVEVKAGESKSPDFETKASALKLASNVHAILKDFFRTPILCALKLGLSWIPSADTVEKNSNPFNAPNLSEEEKRRNYVAPERKRHIYYVRDTEDPKRHRSHNRESLNVRPVRRYPDRFFIRQYQDRRQNRDYRSDYY